MMFKSMPYNTQFGSSMNESSCAASSRFARLSVDTVLAVSIFVILAIVSSAIVLAELSIIILAILSVVIIAVAVLLAEVIIELAYFRRPDAVKA